MPNPNPSPNIAIIAEIWPRPLDFLTYIRKNLDFFSFLAAKKGQKEKYCNITYRIAKVRYTSKISVLKETGILSILNAVRL